ncbi:Ail/Lom family outer membrane beta-barrel protein [Xenorhabdus cabanillasii]|uniref:Virulence membrane protein pagC n=1 Tax=Xenorhabdus cabanillasii JM26 TaxID=1427517 RepID=W1IQL5_9GAMM|nr:Ail/Lom family outer membrane beta-barrel protein [Xenorhabdus cabanillasii]PHM76395.1 virulence membrane protein PagC [Xenorhabdus cabanillasii JM26]CDL79896.1 Virulence membrane protein pagC [Xenorhabdus cabanillasii JM26]
MVTKKALLTTLALFSFMYGSLANADTHTIAAGYARGKITKPADKINLNGFNIHYRYEWDSPVSIIGQFTYMQGRGDRSFWFNNQSIKPVAPTYSKARNSYRTKYFSLMAGPAYRINDYLSIYGLLGISHVTYHISAPFGVSDNINNIDSSTGLAGTWQGLNPDMSYQQIDNKHNTKFSLRTNNIAYGAGIEINPVKNITLYLAYEGTLSKFTDTIPYGEGTNNYINGFNVGIGYRF